MSSIVRNATAPKRVRFQIQARRAERADDAGWFDDGYKPVSKAMAQKMVDSLNKSVPAFHYRAVAV